MQHKIWTMTFIVIAGLTGGCTTAEETVDKDAISVVNPEPMQRERVKKEVKEAVQAIKDYPYTQKARFISETRQEMTGIQTELDQLAAGLKQSEGEAKTDARIRLDTVRKQLTLVKTQLSQAENATEVTWNDVKQALQKSRVELKESFDDSREWLSKKMKP